MKRILISIFDMEIGGVERSLISMLKNFDYEKYQVDLMIFSHKGELLKEIPKQCNILPEIKAYSSFRKSIKTLLKEKRFLLASARIYAKILGLIKGKENEGIYQMQYMWKKSLHFLPMMKQRYDVAISYLWPHYFVKVKVKAKKKIGWIHTDFSKIHPNRKLDLKMWKRFDYIVAVSKDTKEAFLTEYPSLRKKVKVIENLICPKVIKSLAITEERLLPENKFNLLTIGRLTKAKGLDNAILAMEILQNEGYKDLKWSVIGYGGDKEYLESMIKERNLQENFQLLGKKVNPYQYLKQCDLYVQPSRYEGKAVTVNEAKILEKPILITNYPTAKSQINNLTDGVICDLSVEGIVEGIKKLYKDRGLREELSRNCRSIKFSNKHLLMKLYKLME